MRAPNEKLVKTNYTLSAEAKETKSRSPAALYRIDGIHQKIRRRGGQRKGEREREREREKREKNENWHVFDQSATIYIRSVPLAHYKKRAQCQPEG